jgi:hypothetical protein
VFFSGSEEEKDLCCRKGSRNMDNSNFLQTNMPGYEDREEPEIDVRGDDLFSWKQKLMSKI